MKYQQVNFYQKNPYIKFKFKADAVGVKKGDKVTIAWTDLKR